MPNNIDQAVQPMTPKLTQAGAPLGAAHDATFVQRTQSLWYKTMGTVRSWVYPDPDTAPYVQTSTTGSYVSFAIGDATANCTWQVPWHYQKGIDGLVVVAGICTNDELARASIRASLGDLVSAVTAKNCPAAVLPMMIAPPPGLWTRLTDRWNLCPVMLRFTGITSSNFDANRRGTLRLAINFDPRTALDNISIERAARLYYMQAWDVFATPTPDDGA